MRCSFAVAALALAAALASAQSAAEPQFTTGDVGQLACRIVDQGGVTEFGSWLVIEVDNKGIVGAEPLVFEVAPARRNPKLPDEAKRCSRGSLPELRRYGRPVAPGKKQRYWVRTTLPGTAKKLRASVVEACFHDGDALPRPEGCIGAIDHVQCTSFIGTFPVPQIPVHNPFDHDLDLLLLVTLSQPRDTVELYGVHLPAGGSFDWIAWSLPGDSPFLDPQAAPAVAVRATKVEVVDWLLVGVPDRDAGTAQLLAAYRPWIRWEEPRQTVQGAFALAGRQQRLNSDDSDPFAESGRFTLHPDGKVTIEGKTKADTGDAADAIRAAFADLLRRSPEQVATQNRCLPVTATRVEVRGPGFGPIDRGVQVGAEGTPGAGNAPWFELADGRVVADGYGERTRQRWRSVDVDRGYLVTRRENHDGQIYEQFTWQLVDGRWMPSTWRHHQQFGAILFRDETLRLSDLHVTGAMAQPDRTPTGDGVQALRTLWDAAPHVPTAPLEVTAQVEVRTPGTDLIWNGHTRITGTLRFVGIGRSCTQLVLDSGGKLEMEVERQLAAVIYDRFLLWFGHDFNDRPPFDEFFRDATVDAPTARGVFRVHDGPVAEVHTADGRVERFVYADGRERRFDRSKLGDLQVVTRVRDGEASTEIALQLVDGHLLPTRLHFERAFGRDWGPETITLRGLKVH